MATPSATSASDAGPRRRWRFPDAFAFLLICIALATAATYLVPAGEYARRVDPATGRRVVVAGTYARVRPVHVTPFAALVAVPRGFLDAGSVIVFVLLAGAGLTVVERTGALRDGAAWLVSRTRGRGAVVVAVISVAFATGGAVEGMFEEIIPLIPVLLVVTERLGYSPVAAVAMSVGAAVVGNAFSPVNPFQVGIAQRIAGLPLLSGSGFRLVFLAIAIALWMAVVIRTRAGTGRPSEPDDEGTVRLAPRTMILLAVVVLTFGIYLAGVLKLGWEFEQMAAIFFALGLLAGAIGGLGASGTIAAFTDGLRGMVSAAMLIALARAVYLVLDDGRVIDTIVYGLLLPVTHLSRAGAGIAMMLAEAILHVPVPSTTGEAVLSIPILVPLADLLGLSAQIPVLAYQYGGGLCELVTPTNGAMMAILAAAGVRYDEWIRFVLPWFAAMLALGAVAITIGVAWGL